MSSITSSKTPGYKTFDPYQTLPHNEAVRLRVRTDFKNKLKALTKIHHENQEFCQDCPVLSGSINYFLPIKNSYRGRPKGLLSPSSVASAAAAPSSKTVQIQKKKSPEDSTETEVNGVTQIVSRPAAGLRFDENDSFMNVNNTQEPRRKSAWRVPHNEVDNLMTVFMNQHIAHEIAINRCYRLMPSDNNIWSAPETQTDPAIQQITKTFWQLFQEEIETNAKSTRKNYSSYHVTFEIFSQLRLQLLSVLMPHNYELRESLQRVLETDLVKMKEDLSENPIEFDIDYDSYKIYAVDILSQICCPSRDEEVEAILKVQNPIAAFRLIFELIYKMTTDMNNFFLNLFRPTIMKNSIETERKRFADFIELEYRLHEDGLQATRSWLMRHRLGVRDTLTVIAKAYGEILYWTRSDAWPETCLEDIERFHRMKKTLDRIGIVGGVVLEMGKMCHKIFKNPPPVLRQTISKYIKLLIPTFEEELTVDYVKKMLEPVAQKSGEAIESIITKYLKRPIRSQEKAQLYEGIMKVADPENSFRKLMIQRTKDYAEEVIIAAREYHVTVPSTLAAVMYEVAILVSEFHRIVLHNCACFEELYRDIVEERNNIPKYPEENYYNWDLGLLHTLRKLRTPIATPEEAREIEARELQRQSIQPLQFQELSEGVGGDNSVGVGELKRNNNYLPKKLDACPLQSSQISVASDLIVVRSHSKDDVTGVTVPPESGGGVPQRKFNLNLVHTMKTVAALNQKNPEAADNIFGEEGMRLRADLDDGKGLDPEERKQVLAWAKENLQNELIIFKKFCTECNDSRCTPRM